MCGEWKSIKSAPRDGTRFFVWEPEAEPNIAVAYFTTYDGDDYICYADELLSDACPEGPDASHWRPLFDGPTA